MSAQGSRAAKAPDPWERPGTRPNPSNLFSLFEVYFQQYKNSKNFSFFKKIFFEEHPPGLSGPKESLLPAPNYNTPVKDLAYKDLLTSTFTLASHERGIKTWCVPATYPECLLRQNVSS
jgi:hypothetical protein